MSVYDGFGREKVDTWCWGFFVPNRFFFRYNVIMHGGGWQDTNPCNYYTLKGNLGVALHERRVTGNPPVLSVENVSSSVGNSAIEMTGMATVVGAFNCC